MILETLWCGYFDGNSTKLFEGVKTENTHETKRIFNRCKRQQKAEKYYHDLFGLETLSDNDGNIALSGGLFLQEEKYWRTFLGRDILPKNNACELYFEEENLDAFFEKLKALYPETEFVNLPMTHSWGQRVMRFYDPDGNLIEVGTPV